MGETKIYEIDSVILDLELVWVGRNWNSWPNMVFWLVVVNQ